MYDDCGEIKNFSTWEEIWNYSTCGDIQMPDVENFRFFHICHGKTSEISPHVENFFISLQSSYMESWKFSTWKFFLHRYNLWYLWQISGLDLNWNEINRIKPITIFNICWSFWLFRMFLVFACCKKFNLTFLVLAFNYLFVSSERSPLRHDFIHDDPQATFFHFWAPIYMSTCMLMLVLLISVVTPKYVSLGD